MMMNPIPPQAYTKDTLLKAYSWLQNQPPNIKEMASTPDILVSLFLKTTRDGEGALTRPSIQNFKNELKELAGMMGDFEAPTPPPPQQAPQPQPTKLAQPVTAVTPSEYIPPSYSAPLPEPTLQVHTHKIELDSKSWFMIQEVKETLNLSSEMETIRVLIKIGSERIKSL